MQNVILVDGKVSVFKRLWQSAEVIPYIDVIASHGPELCQYIMLEQEWHWGAGCTDQQRAQLRVHGLTVAQRRHHRR